jgi:hypothetical protein
LSLISITVVDPEEDWEEEAEDFDRLLDLLPDPLS